MGLAWRPLSIVVVMMDLGSLKTDAWAGAVPWWGIHAAHKCARCGACHEGEDAEVDHDGEQKHADSACDALQHGGLHGLVEEQLPQASKVHCTKRSVPSIAIHR